MPGFARHFSQESRKRSHGRAARKTAYAAHERMETAMLVTSMIHLAPRTIAPARTARAIYFGKIARIGFKRLKRRVAAWRERVALARQYERELAVLLQADDRMLSDIGLTRADVHAASQSRWFTPGRMIEAAAERRKEAMQAAQARHDLPHVIAPAVAPGAPAQLLMVETANYR
jgi:uncharacterized protein YjiS (DUF1127 family)